MDTRGLEAARGARLLPRMVGCRWGPQPSTPSLHPEPRSPSGPPASVSGARGRLWDGLGLSEAASDIHPSPQRKPCCCGGTGQPGDPSLRHHTCFYSRFSPLSPDMEIRRQRRPRRPARFINHRGWRESTARLVPAGWAPWNSEQKHWELLR